jgi:AraC family transcriptional activator of mar-sox-rob regulon
MDKNDFIMELISWLEKNFEQPLSLEIVAKKSGYSKWHLQRTFKQVTGYSMGDYIRKRRLTKAAIALRTTSRSISDIAFQYAFNSQQTFTRSFKKQFFVSPAKYRRAKNWNMSGMRLPIRMDELIHMTGPSSDINK